MINALRELDKDLDHKQIKCAMINYYPSRVWETMGETPPKSRELKLKVGYTSQEYLDFMNALDFEYDNGYGGQELYGMIWVEGEDTWLTRGEYDGSEWWNVNKIPVVPQELI